MAIIRLTPETAGDVVRQVVTDFSELVEAAGKSPALVKLRQSAGELEQLVDSGVFEIEVILGDKLLPAWVRPMATWLQLDEAMLVDALSEQKEVELPVSFDRPFSVVRLRSERVQPGKHAGARVPPILVVAHGSKDGPEAELKDELVESIQTRPLTFILALKEAPWAKGLVALGSREAWTCELVELETLSEQDLAATLSDPTWSRAKPFLLGWSIAITLGSMYQAFLLAVEKEQRSLGAKRALLDQKAAVGQQQTGGNPTEIMGEVRSYIQKQFDTYQKGVAERLQSLVAPFDGSLSKEIDQKLDAFDEFEIAKKPKINVTKVPKAFLDNLIQRCKETLGAVGRTDLLKMNEMLRTTQEHLEKLIESLGGPPTVLHFHFLPDSAIHNLLQRSVGFQRPYSGQLSRRGPMDYFMAARRYQMVFFMMFSAFGMSFIRGYREFMVPATVLLLSFGLLNVINSTRKQEKENEEKELEKAREMLRTDLRRVFSDVEKNWSSTVSGHLAEQQSAALEQIESTVSSHFEQASRKSAEDKILQQRQAKGLDLSDRKMIEAVKRAQAAPQDLEALSAQIKTIYATVVQPAQPGAPGVGTPGAAPPPGMARPGMPAAAGAAPGAPPTPGAARAGATPAPPPPSTAQAEALQKIKDLQQKKTAPETASKGADALKERQAEAQKKLEALKAKVGKGGKSAGASKPDAAAKSEAPEEKPAPAARPASRAKERLAELKAKMSKGAKPAAAAKPDAPAAPKAPDQKPAAAAPPAANAKQKLAELKAKMSRGAKPAAPAEPEATAKPETPAARETADKKPAPAAPPAADAKKKLAELKAKMTKGAKPAAAAKPDAPAESKAADKNPEAATSPAAGTPESSAESTKKAGTQEKQRAPAKPEDLAERQAEAQRRVEELRAQLDKKSGGPAKPKPTAPANADSSAASKTPPAGELLPDAELDKTAMISTAKKDSAGASGKSSPDKADSEKSE